jgi:RHS repeat-associated protein
MNRSTLFSKLWLCISAVLLTTAARGEPVLHNDNDLLTTSHLSHTRLQDALPILCNRGSDLEGGIRFGGDVPAGPGFNSGMGAATMGGIELSSLGFALSEVDMALPTNGPAVVIGRSFNHRQEDDSKVAPSNGLMGYNWFQSAIPEIYLYVATNNEDDVLYLVYGSNRYLEFRRTGHNATTFRGKNGATGIVEYVAGNGSTTYHTYTFTDQNGWQWVFWGNNTASHKADWQLWKKSDPQGLTVYAGDKTSHSSAVTNGYASAGGISTLYQEFGVPGSVLERKYSFTYTTVSSVDRLTEVKAEIKSGGTWGSPSGLTEIGRVTYDYYSTWTYTTGTSTDTHGNAGDLKQVTIRTPLTDSGSTLSSGIYDRRVKYYRYYNSYANNDGERGHIHTLKLVLGFEGSRRYDWTDITFDDDFADDTNAANATGNLKPYSDAYYEYDSDANTQRIATAFFNGECGCGGGGAANGQYSFARSTNGSYTDNSGYDTAWMCRTVITQPDSTYQVRYFDEIGQPLSTVITTNTGSGPYWVTGVVRDSNGRVTEIHSPANLNTYTHTGGSAGAITYLSSSSTGGLISTLTRYTSTDLTGLIKETACQTGTGGGSVLLTHTDFDQRDFSVASQTISKPFATGVKQYFNTGGGDHDDVSYDFTWWEPSTATDRLYVVPQSIKTTLPAVTTGSNGANTTHDLFTYLRKDGRTAISIAADGIYTAVKYNEMGLPVRTIQDADPNNSGDFDTNYGPGDFSLSTSTNNGLKYPSETVYDNIGRVVNSIARPDGSSPVKRIAEMYYSKLVDGRLATIAFPRVVSTTYYGPASYSVTNHAGKSEFSCVLGFGSDSSSKADWLNETYADPIDALAHASANLGATNRLNIFRIATTIYDTPGSKVTESRQYTKFDPTGAWDTGGGNLYDATSYSYDSMGRVERTVDPTRTISRTVFDALGRTTSRWVGLTDVHGWTSTSGNGSSGGSDDMTQVEWLLYDGATTSTLSVGNSLLTRRTAYVAGDVSTGIGSTTGQRITDYLYDVRGNLIVTEPPLAPFSVNKYDLRRRVTATALYSSTSGLTAATDPAATGATSNRVALSKTFYDSRGQVWKSERWKITQSNGTDADHLEALTWRDAAGRVIKQGGTSNSKTAYDRLGRVIHQYTLARNDDSTYAHATDVAGDIVLEQSDTVYDNEDKTGLVVMTANFMRNYNDITTGTGGLYPDALDSNADNNVYKYTAADLVGHTQITCYWYDELDRPQDTVAYGTYGNADFDRRPSSVWLGVPSRSSTALRTTTVYNDNGTVAAVQAPKVDTNPIETDYRYDQALRKVAEIRNYKNGTPSSAIGDDDVYTRYTYDAGRMTEMWVDVDGDGVQDADDQVTKYFYGTTRNNTTGTSRIASNLLLDHVRYPAQGIASETTDKQSTFYAYNAQGQKIWQKDNNGTVLEWTYDTAGRKTLEDATSLGSGIDGAIRGVSTSYTSRGMVDEVIQYDATGGAGSTPDGVQYLYDDWGNLTDYRQDNFNRVGSGTDYDTYYTYTVVDTTSPTAGTRRSGIRRATQGYYYGASSGSSGAGTKKYEITNTYTNSDFGTTVYDDDAGRPTRMTRSYPTSAVLLNLFRYGGSGTLVRNYLVESGVTNATASTGVSGWNDGYDRFNRVKRSLWANGSTGGTYYDSSPAYDDNSNITSVENNWVTPWSDTYEVDNLNRLKDHLSGVISAGTISTPRRQEKWKNGGTPELDQKGNWLYYKREREGTTRDDWAGNSFTHSTSPGVNQVCCLKGRHALGIDWDPTTDFNGLLTADDVVTTAEAVLQPLAVPEGYQYVYDAWNRLVTVKDSSANIVEEFRYNGLGHRIGWHYDYDADKDVDGSDAWVYFQYNERWQQVALYVGANTDPTETFIYLNAGRDGYGGSSYIDDVVLRERDTDSDGDLDERYYYLQNQHHDVVAIMNADGQTKEKIVYDAYGRPSSFSPADIYNTALSTGRPDGVVDSNDTASWSTGGLAWNKDIGGPGGIPIPNGVVSNGTTNVDDYLTIKNLEGTFAGGWDLLGDSTVGNRKGMAGYEFDNIINADGAVDKRPLYHVRHRVLAADTGKWLQKDPLGYVDGMDLYEYAGDNPLTAPGPSRGGADCIPTTYSLRGCKDCCAATNPNDPRAQLFCIRRCDDYYITPTPLRWNLTNGCYTVCNNMPGGGASGCDGNGNKISCNCLATNVSSPTPAQTTAIECIDMCEGLHQPNFTCPPTGIKPIWTIKRECSECLVNTCAYDCIKIKCQAIATPGTDLADCINLLNRIKDVRDTNCAICNGAPHN